MYKKIIILAITSIIFLFKPSTISADISVAGESAKLKRSVDGSDSRVETLSNYLASHNSPLEPYSKDFIRYADAYGLDWRLVPAITGVESTFGKRIPYRSYNAYGWANGEYKFKSWEHSIEVVSKTLKEKYIEKGAPSIRKIAKRYAPPSSTWAGKVKSIMRKIEPYPIEFSLDG